MKNILQRLERLEGKNGQHRGYFGAKYVENPTTKEDLDDLFDDLQNELPWPTGRIDEETQPEFCQMIREILKELLGPHRNGDTP
jgi:hypothetical protein